MNSYPWEVVVLSVILLSNRLVARAYWGQAAGFWSVQAVNLGAAVYIAYFGISGLQSFGPVNYLVSALLVFHIAQNFGIRQRLLQSRAAEQRFREEAQKARSIAKGVNPE